MAGRIVGEIHHERQPLHDVQLAPRPRALDGHEEAVGVGHVEHASGRMEGRHDLVVVGVVHHGLGPLEDGEADRPHLAHLDAPQLQEDGRDGGAEHLEADVPRAGDPLGELVPVRDQLHVHVVPRLLDKLAKVAVGERLEESFPEAGPTGSALGRAEVHVGLEEPGGSKLDDAVDPLQLHAQAEVEREVAGVHHVLQPGQEGGGQLLAAVLGALAAQVVQAALGVRAQHALVYLLGMRRERQGVVRLVQVGGVGQVHLQDVAHLVVVRVLAPVLGGDGVWVHPGKVAGGLRARLRSSVQIVGVHVDDLGALVGHRVTRGDEGDAASDAALQHQDHVDVRDVVELDAGLLQHALKCQLRERDEVAGVQLELEQHLAPERHEALCE